MTKQFSSDDIEQFWSQIKKTDSCWEWTGPTFVQGYGYINTPGGKVNVRRMCWIMHKKHEPKGRLFNSCGNRNCVKPEHLSARRAEDPMEQKVYESKKYQPREKVSEETSLGKFHKYLGMLEHLPRPNDVCRIPPPGSQQLFALVKTKFDEYMSLLAARALEETHPRPFLPEDRV